MARVFFICFKLTEKVKLCLRRHLREGGAWTGESPSEGIVDIIDPGEGSTPLFFIIVTHTIIIVADGHYLGQR